jgi:hypothetical protein
LAVRNAGQKLGDETMSDLFGVVGVGDSSGRPPHGHVAKAEELLAQICRVKKRTEACAKAFRPDSGGSRQDPREQGVTRR